MSSRRVTVVLAMLSISLMMAGCVDLLTDKEVLTEASWYGRVTDGNGTGIANATVTLHVLNGHGEVYSRQVQSASSEQVRGIYVFEHIELRDGADHAFTTCNFTAGNRTMSAVGEIQSLVDHESSTTMNVKGKNITIITYDGVVDEHLVAG